MEVTKRLAEFAVEMKYEKIPEDVIRQAKFAIADSMGAVISGLEESTVEIIRKVLVKDYGPGSATVLGCGMDLAAPGAALANAAAAHALDNDNISLTVSGFVTSPIFFALLAVAEEEDGLSGRQLLEAFVAGYEVEAGIARGLGVYHYANGWHSTSTLAHFGASVAVGKLLNLDVLQMRYVIGVAASEASGVRTMVGNMINPFHVGKAARNGVAAARLVQNGFSAHESVLETNWGFCNAFNGKGNYDLSAMLSGLGEPYDLVDPGLVIKVYPCCGLIHSGLDGVLDLKKEHGVFTEDLRRGQIAVHELVPKTMNFDHPENGYEAKFSIPFCVATAMREGSVKMSHFNDERVRESGMQQIMGCVETVVHPELRGYETFLDKEFTDVTLELKDGRTLQTRVWRLNNRGSKGRPITLEELKEKFLDCTGSRYGKEAAMGVFQKLAELEKVADIREVTACLK